MLKLNVKENQLLTTKFMTKYTANDFKRILLIFHSLVPMLNYKYPTPGTNVKQGWVQQIYKYLLDFYPCSSSSCTSGLLEVYG